MMNSFPNLVLTRCNGCNRFIQPKDNLVKFPCPDCDDPKLIWRCGFCREHGVSYKCDTCGFVGP